ncbi:Nif3-like dinuclear metal center hexameric protein [Mesonia aestuariivivens]|uniref:GTP cyclohydrolase 1 type 2 homolog n=1 Tax=Mesonia aestuariivivens TaxID=2796128 RepID=A0ABS6W547_9FLAO|nr:Nif3-like dinuclear metal center hexameric protein [Mesonia aestuariivivens]MBW2962988.1 Nif3-like dinuclear metal center hexameric protein [Mesonia aestuariivivens]
MVINEVISTLEELAPTAYAEDFDNVGLLVGDKTAEVSGILVTLDTLEETVDEAIQNNCNLIVSFHPIIFKGLKKITGKTYVERVVLKAIKNDIAIYAIHTALDNSFKGVNHQICEEIGLVNRQVLVPQLQTIKKLVAHVPHKNVEAVRDALFKAGAGSIGNYDNCSFNILGKGTFKANEQANPTLGEIGKLHTEEETQLQLTYPKHIESKVLKALFKTHPYEEVAYEITTLENKNQQIGIGMLGELPESESEHEFLERIKKTFQLKVIRHSKLLNKKIKKVAVLGGSGAFAIPQAKALQADIYITADLKYHDFYQAENELVLADIGHYESEQYTKNLLHSYLTKKIRNFAIVLSQKSTNPIQYS